MRHDCLMSARGMSQEDSRGITSLSMLSPLESIDVVGHEAQAHAVRAGVPLGRGRHPKERDRRDGRCELASCLGLIQGERTSSPLAEPCHPRVHSHQRFCQSCQGGSRAMWLRWGEKPLQHRRSRRHQGPIHWVAPGAKRRHCSRGRRIRQRRVRRRPPQVR